jgi:hypothetical protein
MAQRGAEWGGRIGGEATTPMRMRVGKEIGGRRNVEVSMPVGPICCAGLVRQRVDGTKHNLFKGQETNFL